MKVGGKASRCAPTLGRRRRGGEEYRDGGLSAKCISSVRR